MPINYKEYPANWLTEIRPEILERAKNCCEHCGVANYALGFRDGSIFYLFEAEFSRKFNYRKPSKIILTIAHLNQDVSDNRLENLAALCQYCHLNHDRRDNLYRKKFGRDYKNSLLFDKTTFDNLKIEKR